MAELFFLLGTCKKASTGLRSGVWKYFKKEGKTQTAQCSHCPKTLCCKGSSTSGMARHLQKVHNIIIKKK